MFTERTKKTSARHETDFADTDNEQKTRRICWVNRITSGQVIPVRLAGAFVGQISTLVKPIK